MINLGIHQHLDLCCTMEPPTGKSLELNLCGEPSRGGEPGGQLVVDARGLRHLANGLHHVILLWHFLCYLEGLDEQI